jgi:hypothetical protein
MKVNRREFDAVLQKLIATPAIPMKSIPRKRSKASVPPPKDQTPQAT